MSDRKSTKNQDLMLVGRGRCFMDGGIVGKCKERYRSIDEGGKAQQSTIKPLIKYGYYVGSNKCEK